MFKKITLTTALIASFGTAHAYQAEIGGTIAVVDPDHGDTSTGFALDGTYYFNPVQVKNNPLNEAAFLNRSSNLNGEVSYIDYDVYEVTAFNVGLEYFIPNSDFYLNGNIGQTKHEADGVEDLDTTIYSAEVGYLPVPGLLIAAGLLGYDNDEFGVSARKFFTPQVSLEGRVGFGEQFNNDYNSFGLAAKYRF